MGFLTAVGAYTFHATSSLSFPPFGGGAEGRLTGGVSDRPPVPQSLYIKAIQEIMGVCEVKKPKKVFCGKWRDKHKKVTVSFSVSEIMSNFAP